jgi:hypothetical protein
VPTAPSLVLPYPRLARVPDFPRGSAASRVRTFAADAASLLALVAAIPFAIIAVGMPVVLTVRLLLWIAKLL